MQKLLSFAAIAAILGSAAAQNLVMPQQFSGAGYGPVSYYGLHNGISGLTWRSTAFRFQMIYDTTVFTNVGVNGPITINRLRFRAADGVVNAGGQVYTGATVQMSSSPSAHTAPSTTFATNRGVDNTIVFNGNVTVAPATGTTPNDYVIDITLTTPFVYDPTLGLDLCVEADAPLPVPAGMPNLATSVTTATDGGIRISAATQAATTGTTSGFASVIAIDFTGPGGAATVVPAENSTYGTGCEAPSGARSWYEFFPAPGSANFDLDPVAPAVNSVRMIPTGTDTYQVVPGSNAWFTPAGPRLLANAAAPTTAMGDDSLSVALALPFTFAFPSGSTSTIHAASNGYIVLANLGTTSTSSDLSAAVTDMLGSTTGTHYNNPRLFPAWKDWHCSTNTVGTGALLPGCYYDVDAPNGVVYVTWYEISEFGVTANTTYNSFQVAIYSTGDVEYRYGAMNMTSVSTTQNIITGFSPGNVAGTASNDPGNRDITAAMPFNTSAPEIGTMGLNIQAAGFLNATRAVLGQNVTFVTSNISPSYLISVNVLSFGQINPGTPLPGTTACSQYIDLTGSDSFALIGTNLRTLTMPTDPSWIGALLYSQSAALAPGVNVFGVVTSNGLRFKIGNF